MCDFCEGKEAYINYHGNFETPQDNFELGISSCEHGYLYVRYVRDNLDNFIFDWDKFPIKYCPFCGKKLGE